MADQSRVAERLSDLRASWRAWAILLVAGLSWGATFSLAKIATKNGAEPLGVTLWQGLLGAAILAIVETSRRRRLPLDRHHLGFYLLCGLLGTVIPSTLYYYAAPHLPAGVLGITAAFVPLLTFVGAALLRLEPVQPLRLIGVLLGIIAVLMIALPETSLPEHAGDEIRLGQPRRSFGLLRISAGNLAGEFRRQSGNALDFFGHRAELGVKDDLA